MLGSHWDMFGVTLGAPWGRSGGGDPPHPAEIVAYRFQSAVPHPLHPLDTNVSKLKKDAALVQREPLVDMAKFETWQ